MNVAARQNSPTLSMILNQDSNLKEHAEYIEYTRSSQPSTMLYLYINLT